MVKFLVRITTVVILIFNYSMIYPQVNSINQRERFKEIYTRIYLDYYVQEKYSDALSVLLRLNPASLDDSSKVDLYLLLGRIYVNLNESEKANEAFRNALKINGKYVPPPGEWLPNEEQVFFDTKEDFQSSLKKKLEESRKSILTKTIQFIKANSLKVIAGAGIVTGGILLLNNKNKKTEEPLPDPPDFPNK